MRKKGLLLIATMLLSMTAHAQLDLVTVEISDGIIDTTLKETIESNATILISEFNRTIMEGGKPKLPKSICSKETTEDILKMWKSSPMSCPVSSIKEKLLSSPGGYQIRNIPITLMNAPDDKADQDLVINFTNTGEIDNVMIAIDENRYLDVISANISVNDLSRRQIIVDFVENFRTAYNRQDINFLNSVFSDNALIITGKVIKVKKNSDMAGSLMSQEKVIYQKQSKAQYLENLKRCFKRNKYIDITFDSLEVLRHPRYDDIYGVNLKQYWNSSTYSDIGYVFLLIDFKDDAQPCIQVRTWQPEKYNGKQINRNEIFTLSSFNIKR